MFGSHTKSFHPGRAAQNGLLAAIMAQEGYTSSEQVLEAKRGWANVVGATKPKEMMDSDCLGKWLGLDADKSYGLFQTTSSKAADGRWETLRNSFKPFPCGIVIHPIIDGCIQLHNQLRSSGQSFNDIASVHAKVHPLVLELTGKRTPTDELQAKFSVFHGASIGLIYGRGTPTEYEDLIVRDSAVIDLRDRVDATADEALGADETLITVTMRDDSTIVKHVQHSVGSTEVPLDDAMLDFKFKDQCKAVLGHRTEAVCEALWGVQGVEDMRDVTKLL
jgi:aconitate decarboxylase